MPSFATLTDTVTCSRLLLRHLQPTEIVTCSPTGPQHAFDHLSFSCIQGLDERESGERKEERKKFRLPELGRRFFSSAQTQTFESFSFFFLSPPPPPLFFFFFLFFFVVFGLLFYFIFNSKSSSFPPFPPPPPPLSLSLSERYREVTENCPLPSAKKRGNTVHIDLPACYITHAGVYPRGHSVIHKHRRVELRRSAFCRMSIVLSTKAGTRTWQLRQICRLVVSGKNFRLLLRRLESTAHSEHRFPAPSSKLRALLSGTFFQTLASFGYATEEALFISAQLSTDAVSALRKVRVLIWLKPNSKHWFTTSFLGGRCRTAVLGVWIGLQKQPSAQTRT